MERRNHTMEYSTSGSGALAPDYIGETTARPLRKPRPEPKRAPRRAPRRAVRPEPRARMEVSAFGVLGLSMVCIMLTLVIFGYAQVYASECAIGAMEDEIQTLKEENERLQNKYDTSINLEEVEARAMELGMQRPTGKQNVSLRIPGEDVTLVAGKSADNFFTEAWNAIAETARALWDYLR